MQNRKYQVFISSTYSDLVEERKKVLDVLLMADCIPAGMEAFVATDVEQFEVIKKVIDLCDYYILIIGQRYGSINPDTGISYTEMEYDYAIKNKIPVLVFVLDEQIVLPDDKKENEPDKVERLKAFREKALTNRLCSIWKNTDELVGKVAVSIMTAKETIERPGWQRGTDFDEASLRRTIMKLKEENENLKVKLNDSIETVHSFTEIKNVAFENYDVKIDYHYTPAGSYRRSGSIEKKLPEIFKVIATQMMDVSLTESAISDAIKSKYASITGCMVYFNDSQQIKIILNQLRALGLIYSSWSENAGKLYWGLTIKGRRYRDEMIVVKENMMSVDNTEE
ncbi:DUF4062 domain-containing protein [Roseburia hominis]|uniref:DUF4062 domain-containing protein n=1 Tax=Roseburia hominis TaxID=301301 RepID=UPI0026589927|nr:DUF4062 domain-containing protein [Roseburia hominis]